MSESNEWAIPAEAQPKHEDYAFDLEARLASIVSLRSEIPDDAFTASILGTERAGHGVVIGDGGLVLTVGYLITEAETVWLVSNQGTAAAAHVVGYDQASGVGLVQALGRLGVPALEFGSSSRAAVGDPVIIAGQGGRSHAIGASITGKREFAGYWEYVLDEALFTAPAHPNWGGAACIGADGKLLGIGSLLIQEGPEDSSDSSNLIVPIDLLPPILDDLLKFGRAQRPPRPWLGMYTADTVDSVCVVGLATDGPAHKAGIRVGDDVVQVADGEVLDLADMLRKVWALGPAGIEIPLIVMRHGKRVEVRLQSADRTAFLKQAPLH